METVQLSPFEVRADDDAGYQAANTTAGSRLNSKLKDTPAIRGMIHKVRHLVVVE